MINATTNIKKKSPPFLPEHRSPSKGWGSPKLEKSLVRVVGRGEVGMTKNLFLLDQFGNKVTITFLKTTGFGPV